MYIYIVTFTYTIIGMYSTIYCAVRGAPLVVTKNAGRKNIFYASARDRAEFPTNGLRPSRQSRCPDEIPTIFIHTKSQVTIYECEPPWKVLVARNNSSEIAEITSQTAQVITKTGFAFFFIN